MRLDLQSLLSRINSQAAWWKFSRFSSTWYMLQSPPPVKTCSSGVRAEAAIECKQDVEQPTAPPSALLVVTKLDFLMRRPPALNNLLAPPDLMLFWPIPGVDRE
ncbi:hypothetical protein CEXT_407461 [Caerostris extrusa]|uniref:Uncharacterized protein n=1 Tax=Caerostris extrusa TaxID=172846 RepID=A0AAV4QTN2_CAEEX|nr:hypothetical protein CEXT_407461 [Caerostris extrusa]